MNIFFYFYIVSWITACLIALAIYLDQPQSYAISQKDYWCFLTQPWKLVTFVIASAGVILIAPYTGDPTWDYVDALFMSVFAFTTAPWTAGTFYQIVRGEKPWQQAYVAFCVWMFSASWSYDGYLVLRDGDYPETWFSNIFASSVLYWCAGLLWSLEWNPARGVIFAFMQPNWPHPSAHSKFTKIIWAALPFMLIVSIMLLSFVFNFFYA